jgi:hypothetical protein
LWCRLPGKFPRLAPITGRNGVPRSTYCFRHTYATLRLQEGVDVYFLAEQMGTSIHMIEEHYGPVNTIAHADRVRRAWRDGSCRTRKWTLPGPKHRRRRRCTINPSEVSTAGQADRESPEAVFGRIRWRRLAQGGNHFHVRSRRYSYIGSDLPLPPGAFLAANLRAGAATGGCSSCALCLLDGR